VNCGNVQKALKKLLISSVPSLE